MKQISKKKKTALFKPINEEQFYSLGGGILEQARNGFEHGEFELGEMRALHKDLLKIIFAMDGKFHHIVLLEDTNAVILREDKHIIKMPIQSMRNRIANTGGLCPIRKED